MSIRQDDPALEALLMPFLTGRLAWPQAGALFLRARQGHGLVPSAWPGLVCEQSFKPEADALERACGLPMPASLRDLRSKARRHNDVVEPAAMADEVRRWVD